MLESLILGFLGYFIKTFRQNAIFFDKVGREVDIKLWDGFAFLPGLPNQLL